MNNTMLMEVYSKKIIQLIAHHIYIQMIKQYMKIMNI